MVEIVEAGEAEPYGRLIDPSEWPGSPGEMVQYWPDLAIFDMEGRQARLGFARVERGTGLIARLERHVRTSEFLIPSSGDILVPVSMPQSAATSTDPSAAPDTAIRAIRVRVGEVLMLSPGAWHAPAHPVAETASYWVLLRAGTGDSDIENIELDPAIAL